MTTMVPVVSRANVVQINEMKESVIYDVDGEYVCSECRKKLELKKRVEVDLLCMKCAVGSFIDAVKDDRTRDSTWIQKRFQKGVE